MIPLSNVQKLQTRSLFQILLSALYSRKNQSHFPQIPINRKELHRWDQRLQRSNRQARVSACVVTHGLLLGHQPSPSQNGYISDNKVPPASAEREHSYSAASFILTYLTRNPDWPLRMEALIILTGNVKVHKLVLHDATSKWASNGLCCADLCSPKLQWSPKP